MADDIGRPGEDPRDVARRRRRQGIRYRAAQAAANQGSGPTMTPSNQSMVPYQERLPTAPEGGGRGGPPAPSGGREVGAPRGENLPAVRREGMPSIRVPSGAAEAMRGAMQSPMARAMGTGRGAAIGRVAEGAMRLGDAARRAYRSMPARTPDTGPDEGPSEPRYTMTPGYEDSMAAGSVAGRERPRPQPARRPAPRRNVDPEGTQAAADAERERQRIAAIRGILEGGDEQPERGFFERLGLRRTNETGMDPATIEQRRNYLGSGAADTNVSYNKKGGLLKAQAPVKKQAYKKGGMVKPKGHGMKEEAMEMKGGRYRGGMKEEMAEMAPMRKKGPMPMMKKGGAVKAPAKKMKSGGKVAPKKMMKGGITSKPKKMMGGGKVKYAKGGMARGCK